MSQLQKLLGEVPKCIHDGLRRCSESLIRNKMVYEERCESCGSLLRTTTRNPGEAMSRPAYDEGSVEHLLYTRPGRLKIVIAALEDAGWPIPEAWRRSCPR